MAKDLSDREFKRVSNALERNRMPTRVQCERMLNEIERLTAALDGARHDLRIQKAVVHDIVSGAEDQIKELVMTAYGDGYEDRQSIESGRQPKHINRQAYLNSVIRALKHTPEKTKDNSDSALSVSPLEKP